MQVQEGHGRIGELAVDDGRNGLTGDNVRVAQAHAARESGFAVGDTPYDTQAGEFTIGQSEQRRKPYTPVLAVKLQPQAPVGVARRVRRSPRKCMTVRISAVACSSAQK